MELIDQWKIQDSLDVYEVKHWGKGYFGINDKRLRELGF
jgi:arginine decarboxylase-like protein